MNRLLFGDNLECLRDATSSPPKPYERKHIAVKVIDFWDNEVISVMPLAAEEVR